MLSESVVIGEYVEFIYCACGCRLTRPRYNKDGSEGKFKHHHNVRVQKPVMPSGEKASRYKNGRSTNDGYIVILKPDHPYAHKRHGYVREHRLVYEEYMTKKWGIRFIIHPSVEVHHINENILDNRIENLKLMTKSEHASYHHIPRIKERQNRLCAVCGQIEKYIRTVRSKGKTYTYRLWNRNPLDKTQWVCQKDYNQLRKQIIKGYFL